MDNKELQILNKNNLLIKSNYDLNLVQNRFYLTILYNMQKQTHDYVCTIAGPDLKKLVQNKSQNRNRGVYNILDSLRKKSIELQEIKKDNVILYNCGIINNFKWEKATDTYTITLDGMIYDLLINYYELNKGYTPLNLGILVGLNNYYAQRFYEILRMESWKGKVVTFTIDYLRETLEIQDKYPKYSNFKSRVILPSIKVLNDTGKFAIDFKENKIGRKVHSIDFIVEDLEIRDYFINESEVKTVSEPVQATHNVEECKTIEIVTQKPIGAKKPLRSTNEIDIPDLDLDFWSKGAQILVKKFLKGYDSEFIEEAYLYASTLMIDKDDVDVLSHKQLNLFKKIFSEYIEKAERDKLDEFFSDVENNMFW